MSPSPLHSPASVLQTLFALQGPSLGLWRAAEIAVLRQHDYARPVLDLGCGDGLVTAMVLGHVETGVDPYRPALEQAATRRLYERLIAQPLEHAAVAPRSVGTIISNSVLEHITDVGAVLRAAARLLRPGGRFVFTVPTEAFGRWLLVPSAHYAAWRNGHYEHRNLWSVDRWRESLDNAGFGVERVRPYLRRPQVATWDAIELMQRVWIGRRRLFGCLWRRLPASTLERLAARCARVDLSSPPPGGGRLIVARRR